MGYSKNSESDWMVLGLTST